MQYFNKKNYLNFNRTFEFEYFAESKFVAKRVNTVKSTI